MRIYMQRPAEDGTPPKFYQVILLQDLIEGWLVIKEWGNQGASGRTKREHFLSRDDAERALMQTRDAQLKRGYQVMFVQGTYT